MAPLDTAGSPHWQLAARQLLDRKPNFGRGFCESEYRFRILSNAKFIRSRCVALIRLLGRLRPRRLNESRDSGHGLGVRRPEGELLREEGDAVAGGFEVERMRRAVDLELLRFAHELEVLLRQVAIQKGFIGCVLQKHRRWRGVGDVFSSIHPGIFGGKGIEFGRSDLLAIFQEGLRFLIDVEREITGHDDKGFEALFCAAEEATGRTIATVSNVGKAPWIDVRAREKEG